MRKQLKRTAALLTAVMISVLMTVTGYAAMWVQDDTGWRYQNTNGTHNFDQWITDSDQWYYLDSNGYMATGWKEVEGKWYYFNESGAMLCNTFTPDGYPVNISGVWVRQTVSNEDLQGAVQADLVKEVERYVDYVESAAYTQYIDAFNAFVDAITSEAPNPDQVREGIRRLEAVNLTAFLDSDGKLVRYMAEQDDIFRIKMVVYGKQFMNALTAQDEGGIDQAYNNMLDALAVLESAAETMLTVVRQ